MLRLSKPILAYLFPVVIFILYTILVIAEYFSEGEFLQNQIAEQRIESIEQQLFRMQHTIELASAIHDATRIEQEVSLASTDMDVMVYVLLDSESRIQFANHVVWRNSNASQVIDGYMTQVHLNVVQSRKPHIEINWPRLSIQAYYPIVPDGRVNYSSPTNLIYMEYDLSSIAATVEHELQQRALRVWLIGSLLIVAFSFLIHLALVRPLRYLVKLARDEDPEAIKRFVPSTFYEVNVLQEYLNRANTSKQESIKRLQDSEQRWLFAVEASRNGVWDWDITTGEVYISDRWKEMIGYEPHELKGEYQTWASRLHPEDRAMVLQSLQDYLNGDTEAFESVHRIKHKDGHYLWVLDRGMLIDWDEDGRPTRVVGIHTDISDDVRNQQTLIHRNAHDELTELANKKALTEQLFELIHSTRSKKWSVLLHIDIDDFKGINDALGHHHGDRILVQIAGRLSGYFKSNTLIARLGGDEFALLAKDLAEDHELASRRALALASEVRQLVARSFHIGNQNLNITASIGICVVENTDVIEPSLLIKHAEIAMYNAKESGKDTCVIYNDDMEAKAQRSLMLQNELRFAVERQELSCVFQPIVGSRGEIVSAELLLRWNHPTLGSVSPAEFIPVAEQSGLILDVGHWVLLQACKFLNRIDDAQLTLNSLAINISGRQFNQPEFVESLLALLSKQEVDPKRIELEITEYALLNNLNVISNRMELLRQQGVSIAIDDFGTGYSSLSYLQSLPLSKLKIDASFVQKIGEGQASGAIVNAIITMAHELNLAVVSEGVETETQRRYLQQQACDLYQGYLFSKPISGSEFIYLLQKGGDLGLAQGS